MKIAITGSSGFVGSHLLEYLSNECKHAVIPVSRQLLYGSLEALVESLEGCDVVIHLAGASILSRWTKKRKRELWNSRIKTTENLVAAFQLMNQVPKCFISTSAVGVFDDREVYDENSHNFSDNFLGRLARQWELEALKAQVLGIRTLIFRLGIVIGKDGGALTQMLPVFRLGMGGPVGSGNQAFPFIHLKDLLKAYQFVLEHEECEGLYHLVAPDLISNRDFSIALAKQLNRPCLFRVPTWCLKLLFSEGAIVLVQGQKILPLRITQSGFLFDYPNINVLLRDIIG
ncbi:MAG: TIGR01777 family oxidoreductase [Marinifilaceae bacterium]